MRPHTSALDPETIALMLPSHHQHHPLLTEATYAAIRIVAQARDDLKLHRALIVPPGPAAAPLHRITQLTADQRAQLLLQAAALPEDNTQRGHVLGIYYGEALRQAALYDRTAAIALKIYQSPQPAADEALDRLKAINAEVEATFADFERWLDSIK